MEIRDCSYCGDSHKFRKCRSRNSGFQLSKLHEVVAEEEDSENNDYAFLGECSTDGVRNPNNNFWYVNAKLNDCGVLLK